MNFWKRGTVFAIELANEWTNELAIELISERAMQVASKIAQLFSKRTDERLKETNANSMLI